MQGGESRSRVALLSTFCLPYPYSLLCPLSCIPTSSRTGVAGLSPSARWRQQSHPLLLQQSRYFTRLPEVSHSLSVMLASRMLPEWCHLRTDAARDAAEMPPQDRCCQDAREVGIGGRGDNEKRGGEGHYNPESELLTCSVQSWRQSPSLPARSGASTERGDCWKRQVVIPKPDLATPSATIYHCNVGKRSWTVS